MKPLFALSGLAVLTGSFLGLVSMTVVAAESGKAPGAGAPVTAALSTTEQGGASLASDVRNRPPAENNEITGVLRVKSGKKRLEIPVLCRVVAGEKSWQTIYEAAGTATQGAEKLIIEHTLHGPNKYFYARAASPGAPVGTPQPVPVQQAYVPFANSDFWLTDLGLEFMHWPRQVQGRGEMRLGQPCYVLESRSNEANGVTRVKSWIDKESYGVLIAEAYDRDNEQVKEFSLSGSSFRKVQGQWQLEKMEIHSLKTGSETVLKFNLPEK